jgi:tetratricopeptide (TPR) repeat protein
MPGHLERARLLYGQERYDLAERELGLSLVEDAQNAAAHALLALCLAEREQFESASEQAAEAVRLAPDDAFGHATAARVWLLRNYLDRAEEAARTSIALDPYNEQWHSLLAAILFRRERWPEALDAAEGALAIDPENVEALNLQAAALRQLGRSSEARGSLQDALAQRPDSAWTHANLGWTCLQQGNPRQAEHHFREALRLDPECEIARRGAIEAIKAKNPVYRWILGGFMWMNRQTTRGQWYIVLGGYIGYRMAASLAQDYPQWGPVLWPLVYLYIGFVVLTWFTTPLSNLFLRLHPFGRLALSKDERRASNWVGGSLGLALLACLAAIVLDSGALVKLAFSFAIFAIPLAMTFQCSETKSRRWMVYYSAALAAAGFVVLLFCLLAMLPPPTIIKLLGDDGNVGRFLTLFQQCDLVFIWGCFLSVWAANIAKSVAWKH